MTIYLLSPHKTPRGKCRICGHLFYDRDSEAAIGRHMARCGQAHYEKTKPERDLLSFLRPWDPEFQSWLTAAYRQGKVRPSKERV